MFKPFRSWPSFLEKLRFCHISPFIENEALRVYVQEVASITRVFAVVCETARHPPLGAFLPAELGSGAAHMAQHVLTECQVTVMGLRGNLRQVSDTRTSPTSSRPSYILPRSHPRLETPCWCLVCYRLWIQKNLVVFGSSAFVAQDKTNARVLTMNISFHAHTQPSVHCLCNTSTT